MSWPRLFSGVHILWRNPDLHFTLKALPIHRSKMPAKISYPSPRVSQLDASILDDELFSLLKQQLSDAFSLLSNKPWSYHSHPELWSLFLKLAIFRLTTFQAGASYGFKLQNLKLSDHRTGKVINTRRRYLLLGTIIGEYLVKKAQSYLFSLEEQYAHPKNLYERVKNALMRHKSNIIKYAGDTVQVLESFNFVSFLVFGRYPNLIYRTLGISVTPVVADLLKFNGTNVNYEFQNRQLVWNVLTEFLVFILPLLQLRKLRRLVRNLMPTRSNDKRHYGYSETPVTTNFTSLPVSQCAMCIESVNARGLNAATTYVTNPFVTNCDHVYCYVCLATRFNAIENGNDYAEGCPRCRLKITSFRQFGSGIGEIDRNAIVVEYEDAESDDNESSGDDDGSDEPQSSDRDSEEEEVEKASPLSELEFLPRSRQPDYSENEDLEEEGEFSDEFESAGEDDMADESYM
ncbi:hypothetical protein OXX79_002874 [Metschnikowia pulcherrima]